ncbi:hypothetical protein FQR65_LT05011 [Abscondita terminalis]|nr:hypothetical protein FQR65_LT05011 [Abscondita terminalis]
MTSEIPMLLWQGINLQTSDNYQTEPSSTSCLSLKNGRCVYPRGRVLGGSSSINAMLYARSTKDDHDGWVAAGNTNWNHESLLKHYRIVENQLNLSTFRPDTEIEATLIKSFQELGFGEYTDENLIGYGYKRFTIGKDGTRTNSAKAFLSNTNHRKNLLVALNARVTKVTFDQNNRATGLQVLINNRMVRLKSKKEIILSAGSINTPQILMRSGIGPKEHLKSLEIPVKNDLRVGKNLQDHVIFTGLLFNVNTPEIPPFSEKKFLDSIYNYFIHRTGPLVKQNLLGFNFFASTKNDTRHPNVDIYYLPCHQNGPNVIEQLYNTFNFRPELIQFFLENNKKSSSMIILPKVLTVKSKGQILLENNNPISTPLIHPNFFSDEEDVEIMLEAIRVVQSVVKTKEFTKWKPELVKLPIDNCNHIEFDSDDFWRCAIKNLGTHLHHPVGTCKMGPKTDPEAVVDPTLKVHGVGGLRVVDASIIPIIPKVGTNAASMMIGSKGAEMIKEQWLNMHTEL